MEMILKQSNTASNLRSYPPAKKKVLKYEHKFGAAPTELDQIKSVPLEQKGKKAHKVDRRREGTVFLGFDTLKRFATQQNVAKVHLAGQAYNTNDGESGVRLDATLFVQLGYDGVLDKSFWARKEGLYVYSDRTHKSVGQNRGRLENVENQIEKFERDYPKGYFEKNRCIITVGTDIQKSSQHKEEKTGAKE
jgi:hypothetical protein